MKTSLIVLLCSVILTLGACKKDEPVPPVTPAVPTEKIIEIKTPYGNMYLWLYKETPLHRENFLKLAGEGYFDSTTFHRIIQNFMIQGGDPNSKDNIPGNDGQGGPNYTIPAEIIDSMKHIPGTVGAARMGDNVNPQRASSGSQFFINVNNNTNLNKQYTVFAVVMQGLDVAKAIVKQPKDANDRPFIDIRMDVNVLEKTKAQILADYGFEVK